MFLELEGYITAEYFFKARQKNSLSEIEYLKIEVVLISLKLRHFLFQFNQNQFCDLFLKEFEPINFTQFVLSNFLYFDTFRHKFLRKPIFPILVGALYHKNENGTFRTILALLGQNRVF